MTPTPRTDAHQSACLRSGGRSCDGGRNAYWLARQLERENVQMLTVLEDLARYPVAGGYYDGPCIERTDMDDIKAAIAAASESKRIAAESADEKPDGQAENVHVRAPLTGSEAGRNGKVELP